MIIVIITVIVFAIVTVVEDMFRAHGHACGRRRDGHGHGSRHRHYRERGRHVDDRDCDGRHDRDRPSCSRP